MKNKKKVNKKILIKMSKNTLLKHQITINFDFVECDQKPPIEQQLRKIETFWAYLKVKVYENDLKSKNVTNLISKIRLKLKDFCPEYFQRPMSKCKAKIRKAVDMAPKYLFT